jgi:hypothetical protein
MFFQHYQHPPNGQSFRKLKRRKLIDTFVVTKDEAAIVITKNCPHPI